MNQLHFHFLNASFRLVFKQSLFSFQFKFIYVFDVVNSLWSDHILQFWSFKFSIQTLTPKTNLIYFPDCPFHVFLPISCNEIIINLFQTFLLRWFKPRLNHGSNSSSEFIFLIIEYLFIILILVTSVDITFVATYNTTATSMTINKSNYFLCDHELVWRIPNHSFILIVGI